jgi:hypothetical protein
MDSWKPVTRDQLEDLAEKELAECTPEQRRVFERYKVPLRHAPIERNGKIEQVFVVAQKVNEVMYYEDVEEGFNFSSLDSEGHILQHWCNQHELKYALWHWMGKPQQDRRGPSEPIDER